MSESKQSFWEKFEGVSSNLGDRPLSESEMARAVELGDIIEAQARDNRELKRESGHDELTGLPNERLFKEQRDVAVARAQRIGEPFHVASIDLAGLGALNEVDHALGDEALQTLSRAMSESAHRATDTVYRISGDQFAAIFEGDSNPEAFIAKLNQQLCKKKYYAAGRPITFYAGIARCDLAEEVRPSLDSLHNNADMAYAQSQKKLSINKALAKAHRRASA